MTPQTRIIAVALASAATLGVTVPFHFWNCRLSRLPLQARAVIDTSMHGLTPAIALAPLWMTPSFSPAGALFVFLCAFLLDLDHVIAFRSVSLIKCSTQERRPFGHSATFALLASAVVGLLAGSPLSGAVCLYSLLTHLFFDATDDSGIPVVYPARRILKGVPLFAYAAFLAAGVAGSAVVAARLDLAGQVI